MNYIELINRFWSEVEMKDYKSQEANLYFFLLHYCNRFGWVNPFSLPNKRAVLSTGLSEKTLIDCRCRLRERGLIDFKAGKRKAAAPVYCLPVEGEDGFYFPWESKTESKTGSKNGSKTGSKTGSINKTINNKPKTNSVADATGDASPPPEDPNLFTGVKGGDVKKPHSPKKPKPEPPPPTFDEVKAYFLSQRADIRLVDWEREAEIFFNHFTSLGWKTSSGAKVSRWDSRANLWIIEHEKKPTTEKPKTDEAGKADKFSERRGSESGAKSRKGFKGTF